MAAFDFAGVRPRTAGRAPTLEDLAQEQERIKAEYDSARWTNEPVAPSQVDIAPEAPAVLESVAAPLPGAIEPNVQAVLDEGVEPPLPAKANEDLPPVVTPEDAFDLTGVRPRGSDDFDFSGVKPREAAPEPETPKQAFEFTGPMGTVAASGQQVPVGGKITFDPKRLSHGLQGAYQAGLLSQEEYEEEMQRAPEIERLAREREELVKKAKQDDKLRAELERRAGDNPELKALLYGAGRGGAMTLGAIGAAKAVGPAAAAITAMTPAAPLAPAVGLVAGTGAAIVGGVAAGMGFDATMESLAKPAPEGLRGNQAAALSTIGGLSPAPSAFQNTDLEKGLLDKHFQEYDAMVAASKLKPEWRLGGELGVAAFSLPVSGVQAVRGLQTVAREAAQQGMPVVPAVLRTAGQAAGVSTAAGAAAVPISSAMTGDPYTAEDVAMAAGGGLLMSGFFIGNKRVPDETVFNIVQKQAAGQGLSKEEAKIFRALETPMRAMMRTLQEQGASTQPGQRPRINVTVDQAGVPGFRQATAAQVSAEFYVPPRLPDAAIARAQSAPLRAPSQAPAVPREAPVNVLPPGEPIIPTPPMTPAMMRPDDFAMTTGTERGLDMDFNPEATTELYAEHFRMVRDAINRNEPVSTDALDLYEMRVPYYVRDEATGLAVFDQPSFDAYQAYVSGQASEASASMREAGGVELLDAIRDLGGLPSPKTGKSKAVWSGELKSLYETSRGARDLGIKGAMNIFRKDAPDVDNLVIGLRQKGFRLETESDLFELLDNRLRSGREVFGMPVQAAEPPSMAPRRGAAPRQMDLLGEADVEFTLTGQTDPKSLTPAEQATRAKAEADAAAAAKAQGDLFGVPRRGAAATPPSGPAWVPPGVARPADTTTPRPDWVLRQGETSEGRRLIKGIENFRPGQQWGYRSIVDHVNRAVQVEMKRSTSQTTRSHPGVYRPGNHTVFTRASQSQINFHEAGHGLEFLIEAKAPGFWRQFEDELLALTQRPDSMASEPPGNASDATKRDYLIGEGVAEWTRLLMVDPPAVQNLRVTAAISEAADRFYPKMAAQLRDAARAVHRFQNKPAADQWGMANAAPDETITTSKLFQLALAKGNSYADAVASGAPFSRFGRRIARSILKEWDESTTKEVRAVDKMRQVRKQTDRIQFAHNYKLMVGGEVARAIKGKGLRMLDMDGNFQNLLDFSWQDVVRTVPAKHYQAWMQYGWARESLNRYEFFTARAREARAKGDAEAAEANMAKAQYPGLYDGITPDKLKQIVKAGEANIPNAQLAFAKQQKYFDALQDLKLRGGMKTKDEVERMMQREDYMPLPKQIYRTGSTGTSSAGDVRVGDFTIKGSQEAIQDLNQVAIERTKQALDAYANNRLMWIMEDVTTKIATDPKVPVLTRILAGQHIVRLNVPSELVVSAEQMRAQVQAAIEKHHKQTMGFAPKIRPQDLQILDALEFDGIWRPVKPNDANVISYVRNGERRYLLVNDPSMFNFFANKQAMDGIIKGMNFWLGPMAENYKRNITQSLGFALAQIPSDAVAQMVLNPDAIGWVPGGSLLHGMWNKLFQKYPQLAQEGLLLSRVEPGETELMDHLRRSSIMQFLGEGFYVGTSKDPVERTVQTWMQPSNYLLYAPVVGFKTQDVINLVSGGRFLAQFGETAGREGAAAYALKMGAKDEEAAMKYWTASGQFNEHPLSANLRGFMRPMMFFNPMVQTMRNFAQIATDPDPAVRARLMARLIQIAALSSAGAAATYAWMSDEEKERERERPIEDRLGYRNLAGFRLRFAYGPEGVVESLAHNAVMDYLLERPKELGRKEAMLVVNRVFDVGSPLAVFGPQVASFFEAGANFSFFRQKPIIAPWMAALPASEQYYMSTPKFYREMGKWLDYSPAKIEYIMRQAIGRQADETIKLMESVTGGRPVDMTYADLPYVGRLFARDPMGFGSMSMRKVDEVDALLRQLDTRLGAKGWSTVMKNPKLDIATLPTNEMRALYTQVQTLEMLRRGHATIQGWPNLSGLDRIKQDARYFGRAELYTEERNAEVLMSRYAQALLANNRDAIEQIESALKLLEQMPERSPQEIAADYIQRVR